MSSPSPSLFLIVMMVAAVVKQTKNPQIRIKKNKAKKKKKKKKKISPVCFPTFRTPSILELRNVSDFIILILIFIMAAKKFPREAGLWGMISI